IVPAISIDIVYRHDAAAHSPTTVTITAKCNGMVNPGFSCIQLSGLLPPAIWIDDIRTAVAIDIPHSKSMGGIISRFRNHVYFPGLSGVSRIKLRIFYGP